MKIKFVSIVFMLALGAQAQEYISFCESKNLRIEFFDNGDGSLVKGPKFLDNGTHEDDYVLAYYGGEEQTGDIQQLSLMSIAGVLDNNGKEIFHLSFKGKNGYFLSAIFDRSGAKAMPSLIPQKVSLGIKNQMGQVEYIQKDAVCGNYKKASSLQNQVDSRVIKLFESYLKSRDGELKDVNFKIQEFKDKNLESVNTRRYVVYYQWKTGELAYDTFYVLLVHGLSTDQIWIPNQLTPYLEQKIVEQMPTL